MNFAGRKKTGFFGAFEAVPSEKVTRGLMEKAEEWLRKQKCEIVIGPVLVNTNQQVGLLVNGPPPFAPATLQSTILQRTPGELWLQKTH